MTSIKDVFKLSTGDITMDRLLIFLENFEMQHLKSKIEKYIAIIEVGHKVTIFIIHHIDNTGILIKKLFCGYVSYFAKVCLCLTTCAKASLYFYRLKICLP